MADNGIQHLTSLDIDISGIYASLQEAQKAIEEYSLQLGETAAKNIQDGLKKTKIDEKIELPFDGFAESAEKAERIVRESTTTINGELKKIYEKKDLGNFNYLETTMQMLKDSSTKVTEKVTTDYEAQTNAMKKAAQEQEKELERQQKIKDDFYKKNKTQIDTEIAERERQSKVFSALIKEQMEAEVKAEQEQEKVRKQRGKDYENLTKQISTLAGKYEALAIKATKSGNKELASDATNASVALRNLSEQTKKQEISTDEAKQSLEQYSNSFPTLKANIDSATGAQQSFIQLIIDKAKWYTAFQIQYQLIDLFKQIHSVVKQTEDAVVELRRVLNEDVSKSAISKELYEIGYEFGRTFEEVSEVATKFAQAGKSWDETIALTRGTMLALNTAELDVTQSTQGLIAVMQQWNFEATDFADIVDKINITGDNFAVTSETIVAALQRASSSAKNANISFEETIGIITAMAEATGRSGENIGTALNSLIVYTTKAASLDTFSGLSERMAEVVKAYRIGATSIFEVWQALSEELQGLNERQQEKLLEMTDYSQFADELESQASEYTDKIRSTYETAGSYRQNYFIALLKDMEKARDAIENMADAEGYSIRENENYMESFSARWNQFIAMLSQLAVQVGDAGLLDLMKSLAQAGIEVTKLAKNLGGIIPILTAISGIIAVKKQQEITKFISNTINGIKNIPAKLHEIKTAVQLVAGEEEKLKAINTLVGGTFSAWAGIAVTAISAVVMAVNAVSAAIEEAKQKAREIANSYMSEAQSIESLKAEYQEIINYTGDASEKQERLAAFKDKLIKAYYGEKDAIEQLNGARSDEIDFLDEEYAKNVRSSYVQIKDQYEAAAKAIENFNQQAKITLIGETDLTILKDYFKNVEAVYNTVNNVGNATKTVSFDFGTNNLYEQVDILNEILSIRGLDAQLERQLKQLLKERTDALEKYGDVYKQYTDTVALNALYEEKIRKQIQAINKEEDAETKKEMYDALVQSLQEIGESAAATERMIALLDMELGFVGDTAEDTGNEIAESFLIAAEQIEALQKNIDKLNSSIDGFQSAMNTVNSAIEEYNSNGYLSIDTIQALLGLGSEYAGILEVTANGIGINQEKLAQLSQEQYQNAQRAIDLAEAEAIAQLANKYLAESEANLAEVSVDAANNTGTLTDAISGVISEFNRGTEAANNFGQAVANALHVDAKSSGYNAFVREANDLHSYFRGLSNQMQQSAANAGAWIKSTGSSSGGGGGSGSSALKKELEAQKKAQKELFDQQKKQLEEEKKLVKERYQAEIDALKKVDKENDRIRKKEEYYRNRQEILNDIERASTRSGIEYREQESEARQKLEDLDRKWQEQLEDWSIEDKIAELEALRDAEIAAIDAEIDRLQALYDAEVAQIQKQLDAITSSGSSGARSVSNAYADTFNNIQKDVTKTGKKVKGETQETTRTIKEQQTEWIKSFTNSNQRVIDSFQGVSKSIKQQNIGGQLYADFETKFFTPTQQRIQQISGMLGALGSMTTSVKIPNMSGAGYYGYSSQTNNSTNTVNNNQNNVFASVYGSNNSRTSGVSFKVRP